MNSQELHDVLAHERIYREASEREQHIVRDHATRCIALGMLPEAYRDDLLAMYMSASAFVAWENHHSATAELVNEINTAHRDRLATEARQRALWAEYEERRIRDLNAAIAARVEAATR